MSFRFGLRFFNSLRQQAAPTLRRPQTFAQRQSRTYADVTAPQQSRFQQLWNSEVGPKTVHFWAPIMKWGLVLAGAADFARPASSLSLTQNCALMATGAIWTRWCFVIKPRNLFLASVNFLLFCVGATQTTRVLLYQRSLEGKTVGEDLKNVAKAEGKDFEGAVREGVEEGRELVKKGEQKIKS